jgi:hypothetical protein
VIGRTVSRYRIANTPVQGGIGVGSLKFLAAHLLLGEAIKAPFQSKLGAIGESGQDGDAAPSFPPSRRMR